MMLPDDIKCCPHCGSDDGYYYTITERYTQSRGFGNESFMDNASDRALLYQGKPRCYSCNKVIKVEEGADG